MNICWCWTWSDPPQLYCLEPLVFCMSVEALKAAIAATTTVLEAEFPNHSVRLQSLQGEYEDVDIRLVQHASSGGFEVVLDADDLTIEDIDEGICRRINEKFQTQVIADLALEQTQSDDFSNTHAFALYHDEAEVAT